MEGVIRGKTKMPRRLLVYGKHGVGKTTFAAGAPSPLFVATEDGQADVGCDRTPVLTETVDVARWLVQLGGPEEHGYKTVVIDSLDWLEKLIWRATCAENSKKTIEDFGYGKGFTMALRRWESLLVMLDGCRARGMNVVLIAHAQRKMCEEPETDPFEQWQPGLHKLAAALVLEWVDEALFAAFSGPSVTQTDSFGRKRVKQVGEHRRMLLSNAAKRSYVAKRRIDLPDEMPMVWSEYAKCWPSDIKGIVVEGSSKIREKKDG